VDLCDAERWIAAERLEKVIDILERHHALPTPRPPMPDPDFRALCAELLQPLAEYDGANPYHEHRALITRARAALLAQPEPAAPTDEELTLVYAYAVAAAVGNKRGPFKTEDAEAAQLAGLRAVLARYGTPANTTNQVH
jgi:hypothetical protein